MYFDNLVVGKSYLLFFLTIHCFPKPVGENIALIEKVILQLPSLCVGVIPLFGFGRSDVVALSDHCSEEVCHLTIIQAATLFSVNQVISVSTFLVEKNPFS